MKLVLADFDTHCSRAVAAEGFITYTANAKKAQLAVVRESRTGAPTTYRYVVESGEAIWIVNDVIHTPEHWLRQERGNTIKCGR